MKVVIVGGVAGGAGAATRIRRLNEHAQIIIFERTGYVSYANCGLPYYIGDVIRDRNALTVQTPMGLKNRYKIDARVHHEVLSIDRKDKKVKVKNLETGYIYEETYDYLLLATGAKPTMPQIPGIDSQKIFQLRTVEDTLKIKQFISNAHVDSVAIIGGGFVGLEMAENFHNIGLAVSIVEAGEHLMPQLDYDMAAYVHTELRAHGVELFLNSPVSAFAERRGKILSIMKDGRSIQTDIVLLSMGVTPDTKLAKEAGLNLGIKGSIAVNDRMQTSDPSIYAVGDAVQLKHFVTGADVLLSSAGPAQKQARVAADNICGGNSQYQGALGTSILKVFDLSVGATGISEATAKNSGYRCESVVLTPVSHASYYPGSNLLTMKVTFDTDSKAILGAQIVGRDGVDKRIDVLATAMRAGLKATELCDIDLAYSPPYSTAKDPVNLAGFMIRNVCEGHVNQFDYETCRSLPRDGSVFLLDTRTPREYASGKAPGFVNIPLDALRDHLDEIPKGKAVYVMCRSGLRSYVAACMLSQYGYECYNFVGGYIHYKVITREKQIADEMSQLEKRT